MARIRRSCLHPVLQCCWQEKLPGERHYSTTLAYIVAGRCCRRLGTSACRVQALSLAGAAAFQASTRSVVSSFAGRSSRRRATIACPLPSGIGCRLPGFAAYGRCEFPAGQQGGPSCTLCRRSWFAAHRCCKLPAGQRGGPSGTECRLLGVCSAWTPQIASWSARRVFRHVIPSALVCSTSLLRIASWSARRAFRHGMPAARVGSAWTRRIASWSARRAFRHCIPSARICITSVLRIASWSARRAFKPGF